jgi:hypothetical protein
MEDEDEEIMEITLLISLEGLIEIYAQRCVYMPDIWRSPLTCLSCMYPLSERESE